MAVPSRRWDDDKWGRGIADGTWIAPSVWELLDELATPTRIAEGPDDRLLLHLRRACEATDSRWVPGQTELRDGVYVVALNWSRPAS